jgi:hypothetical protein
MFSISSGLGSLPFVDIKDPVLTAWLLIQKYGDNAVFIASTEADRFRAARDLENFAVWKNVGRAIHQLSGIKKPNALH